MKESIMEKITLHFSIRHKNSSSGKLETRKSNRKWDN